ncbi:hypothetical protein GYH30_028084 [Glycine max]|nr:hypothetical protein GYH30_028084 [Glycine max]
MHQFYFLLGSWPWLLSATQMHFRKSLALIVILGAFFPVRIPCIQCPSFRNH